MMIQSSFYTPFHEIPGARVRLAQDSLFILDSTTKSIDRSSGFWSKRNVRFLIGYCRYLEGHVFYDERDRNYQRAVCGFFDDMWAHFKSSLSPSHLNLASRMEKKFLQHLEKAQDQYVKAIGIEYEAPLFFTMTIRLVQAMGHSLNSKELVDSLGKLADAIHAGNEKKIEKKFVAVVEQINKFAHDYIKAIFRD